MKNFGKFLACALVAALLVSCSKDGDTDEQQADFAELIIGTWRISSSTTNGNADDLDTCEAMKSVTFTSDGDYRVFTRTGDNCETSIQSNGSYTLNGKSFTGTEGQETIVADILILTENTLSFTYSSDGDSHVDNYSK